MRRWIVFEPAAVIEVMRNLIDCLAIPPFLFHSLLLRCGASGLFLVSTEFFFASDLIQPSLSFVRIVIKPLLNVGRKLAEWNMRNADGVYDRDCRRRDFCHVRSFESIAFRCDERVRLVGALRRGKYQRGRQCQQSYFI